MDSTASIHPPPDELWAGLDIDGIISKASNPECKGVSTTTVEIIPAAAPANEGGIFGRFSRAATSILRLGKRKREEQDQGDVRDTRKEEAEHAYNEAKRLGLLPEPKVFVRPTQRARLHSQARLPQAQGEGNLLGTTYARAFHTKAYAHEQAHFVAHPRRHHVFVTPWT
jgi:hypothetical protein